MWSHLFEIFNAVLFSVVYSVFILTTSVHSFRTTTGFLPRRWASLQDQYRNLSVRLAQSKSPFQRRRLVCFQSNTIFLEADSRLSYSLLAHKIWKRSVEKYKRYETLSKTTHFLSAFSEASGVQQWTETEAGLVQDGSKPHFLKNGNVPGFRTHSTRNVQYSECPGKVRHESSVGRAAGASCPTPGQHQGTGSRLLLNLSWVTGLHQAHQQGKQNEPWPVCV